jgi:hypothetical protein
MKLRAFGVIMVVVLSICATIFSTSTALAECSGQCGGGGSNNNGNLSVVQSDSLSYADSTIQPLPAPGPSGVTNALPLQCTGTEDTYYGLTISNITSTYLSGVNSVTGSSIGLSGGSPNGTTQYNTQNEKSALNSPPINDTLTPNLSYYAIWQGNWYVTSWGTETTKQYNWVESNPPQTTTQNPLPQLPSNEKWVQTGLVRVGWGTVPIYTMYVWEVTGTTTTKYPTACGLNNWTFQGFGITPYCGVTVSGNTSAGLYTTACGTTTPVPGTQPLLVNLLNQLEKNWSAGAVSSSPQPGAITVWVPTTFQLANANLPPLGGYANPPSQTVTAPLPYNRTLTMTLTAQAVPEQVNWTYTANGAQSGAGFTCTVQTAGYSTSGGTNQPNCASPNVGYPSASGYVFTHDATSLHVTAQVVISITVTATWVIAGNTYTATIPLSGGNIATLSSAPLTSTINQVEGVTQPTS